MKKIINKENVNQVPFYQMPKAFFQETKYGEMRNESKLAYMLLRDLLPLSIKNNWVNKEGDIFVKLSRDKMMTLLKIKGTQKAAQVMKELVDYGLIIYKCVGLTKCNEIYICMVEEELPENDKHSPKKKENNFLEILLSNTKEKDSQTHIKTKPIKTNYNKTNINQSVSHKEKDVEARTQKETGRRTQQFEHEQDFVKGLKAVHTLLETQIHIEDLRQQHDPDFVDEIANNICEMYIRSETRVGHQTMPQAIMRGVISKLKMYHIEHVMEQFEEASTKFKIHNPKAYLQTMIYNSIYEANTKIKGHIKYNFGY